MRLWSKKIKVRLLRSADPSLVAPFKILSRAQPPGSPTSTSAMKYSQSMCTPQSPQPPHTSYRPATTPSVATSRFSCSSGPAKNSSR